jgi:MFS family permease
MRVRSRLSQNGRRGNGRGTIPAVNLAPLVSALGIAQIISWGSLFYAIGVLGPAMRKELGISELFLFSTFTAALLVSGTLAPVAGRLIDRRGGRFVLSLGSVLAIAAMLVLAFAPNAAVMIAGWLIAGAAMGFCLYDPAFATLSQHTGERYRRAVTALTLFGGFASTVFWPLSHLLLEAWGWRTTFGIYAGLHAFLCLPIHRLFVPGHLRLPHDPVEKAAGSAPALRDPRFAWLMMSFASATFVFGVIAVHLISLLTTAGLTAAQAVTISMLVGPMQVAGRVIELGFSGRVAYGCGNGVLTIVKGTAPAELFGREGFGTLLGHLSRAGLYAKAFAPASFSGLLALGLTRNAALAAMVTVSVAGMGSFAMALKARK